jgi:environmental stress-induced protein Ves
LFFNKANAMLRDDRCHLDLVRLKEEDSHFCHEKGRMVLFSEMGNLDSNHKIQNRALMVCWFRYETWGNSSEVANQSRKQAVNVISHQP